MNSKKFVAYYRVSTNKQAKSGLGLEAQKSIVFEYTKNRGEVIQEFTEIESGKNKERPELFKATEFCKKENASLIIAKLDRLSRSVSFIFALKESGINFECCDLPDLNTLNLGIFATIAQYEAEIISQRTKNALKEKKKQGFKLGTPQNLTQEAREKGCISRKKNALQNENNLKAFKFAKDLRDKGESYSKIAKKLNKYGFSSPKNATFYACSVRNLLFLFDKKIY